MNNNIYINNINKIQNKSSCRKLCEAVPLFININNNSTLYNK